MNVTSCTRCKDGATHIDPQACEVCGRARPVTTTFANGSVALITLDAEPQHSKTPAAGWVAVCDHMPPEDEQVFLRLAGCYGLGDDTAVLVGHWYACGEPDCPERPDVHWVHPFDDCKEAKYRGRWLLVKYAVVTHWQPLEYPVANLDGSAQVSASSTLGL